MECFVNPTRLSSIVMLAATLTACNGAADTTAPSLISANGVAAASGLAAAGSLNFTENFNPHVAVANRLEATGGSPLYVNGMAVFSEDNGRVYLRTLAAYQNVSFTAEVTVTVQSGFGGDGIAFIGLGAGAPNGDFFGEPATVPSIYTRILPSDFYGPSVNITDATHDNISELPFVATGGSDGTSRVRITWDSAQHTYSFAMQNNYVEGTDFAPTTLVGPYAVGNVFTDARIFFGGSGNVSFANLHVVTRPTK
jgi:hypothetical protein